MRVTLAWNEEYLRSALLRFILQEFRGTSRGMLDVSFAGIVLHREASRRSYMRGGGVGRLS